MTTNKCVNYELSLKHYIFTGINDNRNEWYFIYKKLINLNSKNVTNTINLYNKEKYNDKNTLTNKTRKNGLENQNSKISDVIAINNFDII